MNKLTIHYNSQGESGNIFWILRALRDECHRIGEDPSQFKGTLERVLAASSYEEALTIISEKVTLIDDAQNHQYIKHQQWYVFYDADGNELAAITIKGSFKKEIAATINLLAYENNISPDEITIAEVMR